MNVIFSDLFFFCLYSFHQHFDSTVVSIKEEPEDCGIRSIQKVPSLSDLSDPENSLGKF